MESLDYLGKININFKTTSFQDFFIDFQGKLLSNFTINGAVVNYEDIEFRNHRIKVKNGALLKLNGEENEIQFDFVNSFVSNSTGLHRYQDPKDNLIYIYSHCETYFCHRWFPCFDQPSIRASLDLQVVVPDEDWVVVANAQALSKASIDKPQLESSHRTIPGKSQ